MKSMLGHVVDGDARYEALWFVCPGCLLESYLVGGATYRPSGLNMLPVNTTAKKPAWTFTGSEDCPTIAPSILTHHEQTDADPRPTWVCHSFLRDGVFEFLGDCTHALAGQHVPMVDLPDWFTDER